MIKILYIIENISFGGGERVFAQIINALDKEKYDIYIACNPGGLFKDKIKDCAKVLPFELRNIFSLWNILRLARIMRENNIQIVHSQGGRADFFARIAAKTAGVQTVISTVAMPVERYDTFLLKKAIYIILDRFSEKFVDKFIVVSEALRNRLVRIHRIRPEKVIKIYNGVELEEHYDNTASVYRLRSEFNIEADTKLVAAIGRLVWQKGLGYFLQAIKHITDNKSQVKNKVKFLIVGDGNERSKLVRMAGKLGIEEVVIFAGFREDVKDILAAIDVLVLPSLREGQPIILLEAMAAGKPIIATNIEGVDETIDNGVTGVLVQPGNSGTLAEAIIYLLKDNKKAQELVYASRLAVEKKFTINQMVKSTENVYQNSMRVA